MESVRYDNVEVDDKLVVVPMEEDVLWTLLLVVMFVGYAVITISRMHGELLCANTSVEKVTPQSAPKNADLMLNWQREESTE